MRRNQESSTFQKQSRTETPHYWPLKETRRQDRESAVGFEIWLWRWDRYSRMILFTHCFIRQFRSLRINNDEEWEHPNNQCISHLSIWRCDQQFLYQGRHHDISDSSYSMLIALVYYSSTMYEVYKVDFILSVLISSSSWIYLCNQSAYSCFQHRGFVLR